MNKTLRTLILTFASVGLMLMCIALSLTAQENEASDNVRKPPVDKFSLRWGFIENQTVKYEITEETKSDIENRGSTISEKKKLTTNVKLWCKGKDAENKMLMYYIYDRIRYEHFSSLFPNIRRFDSNKQEDNARAEYDVALKPYSAIINKTFTFNLEPNGKISDVTGFDELINKIFENLTDPIYEPLKIDIQKTFSNRMMQKSLEMLFSVIPNAPVSIGDTWKKDTTIPILYIGDVKVSAIFTLKNVETIHNKSMAQISVSAVYEQLSTDQEFSEILPEFKIKGTIKDSSLKGKITFNITDGLIENYEVTQIKKFEMEAESEGRTLQTEGTITNVITLKPTVEVKTEDIKPENQEPKERPEGSRRNSELDN